MALLAVVYALIGPLELKWAPAQLAAERPAEFLQLLQAMVQIGFNTGLLPSRAHFDTHEQVRAAVHDTNSSTHLALRQLALPKVKCMEWGIFFMDMPEMRRRCDEKWAFNYHPGAFSVDRRSHKLFGDIEEIGQQMAGEFGLIICVSVLEHIRRPLRAIASLGAALGKGGMLLLGAPFAEENHGVPWDFHRYTWQGLVSHAVDAGLCIQSVEAFGSESAVVQWHMGLEPEPATERLKLYSHYGSGKTPRNSAIPGMLLNHGRAYVLSVVVAQQAPCEPVDERFASWLAYYADMKQQGYGCGKIKTCG